jgi:hypothetical protein
MFGLSLLLISIGAITFLDETMLISSAPCGKPRDIPYEIRQRKERNIYFSKSKSNLLIYLRPNRLNIIISGVFLIKMCILFSK